MKKIFGVCVVLFALFLVTLQVSADEEEKFWNERCTEATDTQAKQCEIFQLLTIRDSGQRLMEFAITKLEKDKAARGVVILPLGILLEPGVSLVVDQEKELRFKVRYCTGDGCFAFLHLDKDSVKILRKGDEAVLVMVAQNGQKLAIPVGLKGFSKAYKKL